MLKADFYDIDSVTARSCVEHRATGNEGRTGMAEEHREYWMVDEFLISRDSSADGFRSAV